MAMALLAGDATINGLLEWTQEEGWLFAPGRARPSRRIYIGLTDVTSATSATADAYAAVAPTATLARSTGPLFLEPWEAELVDDPLDDLEQLAGRPQVHDLRKNILDAVNLAPTAERYRRAIQILLQADMTNDARLIVEEGLRDFPTDPSLIRYKKIMAPPEFSLTPSSEVSHRIKADSDWITKNKEAYSGLWVILLSGHLIDAAASLDEVWKRSKDKVKGQRPLVALIESEAYDAPST